MVDAISKRVERLVGSKRQKLAALDDEFFGEVVGVAQAIALNCWAGKSRSHAVRAKKKPPSGHFGRNRACQ
jgi:hypothetical protein